MLNFFAASRGAGSPPGSRSPAPRPSGINEQEKRRVFEKYTTAARIRTHAHVPRRSTRPPCLLLHAARLGRRARWRAMLANAKMTLRPSEAHSTSELHTCV
eukprot:6992730-Prymnesium_polylepis.1